MTDLMEIEAKLLAAGWKRFGLGLGERATFLAPDARRILRVGDALRELEQAERAREE